MVGEETRRTMSLAGLAAVLLVVVVSAVVIRKLQVRCLMEACLLSGQPECGHTIDRLRVSRQFERIWRALSHDHSRTGNTLP